MDCDKAHGYWQLILIDAVTKLSEWMAGPSEYPGYTIADVEQNYVAVEGDALKYAVISITWYNSIAPRHKGILRWDAKPKS